MRFEELDHTADWAFRVQGRDLPELFAQAGEALFALEGASPASEPGEWREVVVEGFDLETLLVNWLNELLFLQETRRETYWQTQVVELGPTRLRARVKAQPRGKIDKLIKAVTFHNLQIEQTPEGWQATLVVDV